VGFVVNKLRTLFWTVLYPLFARLFFDHLGRGVVFEGWLDVPQRGGDIRIGDAVRINRFVEFSVPLGGHLLIERGCSIGRGAVISAHKNVSIGIGSMLAEYVCIHDNDHVFERKEIEIGQQGFIAESIVIGADCWIGAHALVLKGAVIGRGCVIGAGSVVNREVQPGAVAVGSPVRIVRLRGCPA
jgi:acetyltransferase-like isoleucine patch superfamily enzyme